MSANKWEKEFQSRKIFLGDPVKSIYELIPQDRFNIILGNVTDYDILRIDKYKYIDIYMYLNLKVIGEMNKSD